MTTILVAWHNIPLLSHNFMSQKSIQSMAQLGPLFKISQDWNQSVIWTEHLSRGSVEESASFRHWLNSVLCGCRTISLALLAVSQGTIFASRGCVVSFSACHAPPLQQWWGEFLSHFESNFSFCFISLLCF